MANHNSTSSNRSWDSLGLNDKSIDFINNTLKFHYPTPVQSVAIPLFLKRKDVACEAATGSGKTLAFVLPIMEMMSKQLSEGAEASSEFIIPEAASVGAVILSPTRELATQIHDIIMQYIHADPVPHLKCYCFVGGRDIHADRAVIEGAKGSSLILVGTPGRVRHILCEKDINSLSSLRLKTTEVLVLDEADRLLALGFEKDMSDIFAVLPKQRRTCLFSATLAGAEIKQLVKKAGLRNPVHVKVSRQSTSEGDNATYDLPKGLENYYKVIDQRHKLAWMKHFVENRSLGSKVLVFFLTCASVDYHYAILKELWKNEVEGEVASISLHKLHGHMTPSARHKAYKAFSEGSGISKGCTDVMLATDLVARGVDIPKVDWIIQFDLPQSPSFFIHRVGRTARAGRDGQAIACMLESEVDGYLSFLKCRGVSLSKWEDDDVENERYVEEHALGMLEDIRKKYNEKSRDFLDKAVAAFVSFVRGYSEHELSFVFNIKELDLGDVATSFSLLRLPRVKEIMGRRIENFVQSEVAPDSVAYSDPTREAARQERLKKVEVEREERRKKREKITQKSDTIRTRTEKRECRRTTTQHELDSLQKEEALVKKLKKGKITRKQFEHEMKLLDGGVEDDDDDDIINDESSNESDNEESIDHLPGGGGGGGGGGGLNVVTKKRIRKDVLGGGRRKSKKRR